MQEVRTLRSYLTILLWITVLATGIDKTAEYLLKQTDLSVGQRIAIALLPLPGNLALLVIILQIVRSLDEFQRRIQLEAVAVGFLSTATAVFMYGFMQKAHVVGPINMGLVWLFMLVSYGIGYFIALRRYR